MSKPTDERPHDVLAAEEFGMPARDGALRHEPVKLPDEPYPAAEAHDVLAAEEFAMPAGRPGAGADASERRGRRRGRGFGRVAAAAAAVVVGAIALVRRRPAR
jgi:hypothetical protein